MIVKISRVAYGALETGLTTVDPLKGAGWISDDGGTITTVMVR